MTKKFLAVVFIIIQFSGCSSFPAFLTREIGRVNRPESMEQPYVLIVSLDGYRSDYTDRFSPPTLKYLKEHGASTKALLPVFPSKTFTNHYSIATGLYSENHGIVGNYFYDPARNQRFSIKDEDTVRDGTWYQGTP